MAKTNKQRRMELKLEKRLGDFCIVTLICRHCGYKWKPSVKKWRNHYGLLDKSVPKMLRCPCCGTSNRLTQETLDMILAR
jgi:hypothetical protein